MRLRRNRMQVARLIAEACATITLEHVTIGDAGRRWQTKWKIGATYGSVVATTVHLTRSGCLDAAQSYIEDGAAFETPHPLRFPQAGGWPGPLASEYGWERCKECKGNGYEEKQHGVTRAIAHATFALEGWEQTGGTFPTDDGEEPTEVWSRRCTACKGRGFTRKHGIPPGVANGKAIAHLGRLLLEALEGQPSDCLGCDGIGETGPGLAITPHTRISVVAVPGLTIIGEDGQPREAAVGESIRGRCPTCRGTGHNLTGVLPKITWSTAVAVVVADSQRTPSARDDRSRSEWTRRLYDEDRDLSDLVDTIPIPGEHARFGGPATRVVDRGKHREYADSLYCGPEFLVTMPAADRPSLDERISARPHREHERREWLQLPRWRRGEIEHAEARLFRTRRTQVIVVPRATGQALDGIGQVRGLTRNPDERDGDFRQRIVANIQAFALEHTRSRNP
jgi:hypothetical protein